MSKMKGFSLTSILTFLVLCFMGTSFVSASPGEVPEYKPVADEMIGSSGITWQPKVDYARLVLNVAKPDGTVIKETFDSGSTPYLNLSDLLTGNSCDGSYTYELRVISTADKQNMLRKPLTQTGYFSVQGDAIVTPGAPGGLDRVQDIVHDDDVIITGHLGVGPGCTENMSFGNPDGIIIKGEYPHILFDDTRASPTSYNSWRIICPDTGDGSGYFAIEDKQGLMYDVKVFTLEAGAPENSLYVDSNGRIGLGTSTPAYPLELKTTGENATIVLDRTDGATAFINATSTFAGFGSVSNHSLRFLTNSSWKMRINTDGTLDMRDGGSYDGTWNPASSRELKENIENLTTDEAIEALDGLNPVKYNYKTHKDEARVGFIAEDVPELVAMNSKKTLGTVDIIAVLTKVVQQQQKSLEEQQKTISQLKEKIADLEKK